MSFWQIFERINRIARSTTADTFGGRSRFDDELRRAQELIDGERRRDEEEKRQKATGNSDQSNREPRGSDGMTVEEACAIIGVVVTASDQEIRSAYRRRVAEVHPDRFSNRPVSEQREAVARTQQLNEAYAFLKSRSAT
jgi:DnaJ-domain-containing protein 1